MERIESILLRIQGIYYDKREKTNIDIDLMLDYTRVLYADLLEWKKNVPNIEVITQNLEPSAPEIQKNNPEQHENLTTEAVQTKAVQDETIHVDEPERKKEITESEDYPLEIPDETPAEIEREAETENGHIQEIKMGQPFAEDLIYEPAQTPEVPEKTPDEFIYRDRAVLSFEPPKLDEEPEIPHAGIGNDDVQKTENEQQEVIKGLGTDEVLKTIMPEAIEPEIKEEEIKEEEIKEEVKTDPSIPKAESFEMPHSDYSGLFATIQPQMAKDLRKNIGLNDRYLFLNELFGNNKNEYETHLNQLNEMSDLNDAKQYLVTVAKKYNWSKDDETVENFYNVLSKHFSDK